MKRMRYRKERRMGGGDCSREMGTAGGSRRPFGRLEGKRAWPSLRGRTPLADLRPTVVAATAVAAVVAPRRPLGLRPPGLNAWSWPVGRLGRPLGSPVGRLGGPGFGPRLGPDVRLGALDAVRPHVGRALLGPRQRAVVPVRLGTDVAVVPLPRPLVLPLDLATVHRRPALLDLRAVLRRAGAAAIATVAAAVGPRRAAVGFRRRPAARTLAHHRGVVAAARRPVGGPGRLLVDLDP